MTVSSCENLAPVFMVSIGIVALNEEVALPTLLEDVLKQDFPRNRMELLLADSGSTDQTRAIMDRFAAEHGEEFVGVKVLDNPGRIAAAGINVCLGVYTGDAFVRIDAHSTIPANFISSCVAVLEEGEQVAAGLLAYHGVSGDELDEYAACGRGIGVRQLGGGLSFPRGEILCGLGVSCHDAPRGDRGRGPV